MKKITLLTIAALMAFVCPAAQARTMNRGTGNIQSPYIEKGSWLIGLAGGYNNYNTGNLNSAQGAAFLGLITDVAGNATFANASVSGYYFPIKNLGVGIRFGYSQTGVNLDSAKLAATMDLSNYHTEIMTLSGSIGARYYIPLFNSKVFALFAEGRINGKRGFSKDYQQYENGKAGTYSDVYSLSLGVYPGMCLFVTNNVAVELSLPLLEGGYEWDKQITNNEAQSFMGHAFAALQPSLLGINLGIIVSF